MFVQNQVPSIAITSEFTPELLKTVTHKSTDIPGLIDVNKFVEIVLALNDVVRRLSQGLDHV